MEAKLTAKEADEYLARIHYSGPKEPTVEVLKQLQRCHILSVPFENLSVYGKEIIFLSKDWLFEKIVRRHRGGFCFELNTMFSFLLDYFGFEYKMHAAEVFSRKTGLVGPPFDHQLLMANVGGDSWLTDVAFGDSCWMPLRFTDLQEHQKQESGTYRIRKDGDNYFYEENMKIIVDEDGREVRAKEPFTSPGDPNWAPRYKFDLIPRNISDFNEMLLYHQKNDDSPFTHHRICSVAKPWGRVAVLGNKLVTTTFLGENKVKKETREIEGGEEGVIKELEQNFGINRDACLYPEG
ncbi:arylamine N-acetyltransferase, pineal gland isozyme NAT-3-like [Actinia tenebrosa]|uniref:arylamine N-acetyltransferase n=1 Tax=Actinia tenebrosa TaxID=6105 RepID=A0A6P8IIW8_ACTTE|nr:arylamine N-acetyltransferase, pineal gland isozyme NAT-3-like [Actinia tenebrosa]